MGKATEFRSCTIGNSKDEVTIYLFEDSDPPTPLGYQGLIKIPRECVARFCRHLTEMAKPYPIIIDGEPLEREV